jgi:hypothetical protein
MVVLHRRVVSPGAAWFVVNYAMNP